MLKNREKLYQVYHTMLSVVLTWALTLAINHYFELKVSVFLCTVFSLFPAILLYYFDINRKNTISYLILFSIFPIIIFIFWLKKFNLFLWIGELLEWCNSYDGLEIHYVASYAKFIIFSLALISILVFYLLMKKQSAKITLAIILMGLLILLSVNKVYMNKIVVGICIFYMLTILVEVYGIVYSKKAGKQEKKAGILYLAPVCLILAALAICLPSKPEPIQWKGIKVMYRSVKEQIEVWVTDLDYYFSKAEGEFTLNFTGYDEDSGLLGNGGTLNRDNKIAMRVSGFEGNKPTYLIGSVSDIYTGFSWDKSKQDYIEGKPEYLLDYSEFLYALARQDVAVLEDQMFMERKSMRIVYNNIKTKTFFYPIKSNWFGMDNKKEKPITEFSNITFPKALGKGTTYHSVSYELNLQGEGFQSMLRDADAFSYEKEYGISEESKQWIKNNFHNQDKVNAILDNPDYRESLRERAKLIQKQFTVLPSTLPERVRELAIQITEEYDTTFDKLKAIEDFLYEYTYTLQPKKIESDVDFVDYFLFESKEGYCTSYASAMAVLARCIDIPTRYVEGFVVTYKGKEEQNMYPVRNSQAHAWAEAYIEGVGWIPFEATSSYYNSRYTTWKERPKANDGVSADYINPYEQRRIEDLANINGGEYDIIIEEKEEEEQNEIKRMLTGAIICMATILILIIIFMVYYITLRYQYKKAFHKADYSKKMFMMFLRILRLLHREGYNLEQQETIRMLAIRMKDKYHYENVAFSDVGNIFMRYRYAQEAVTREEFDQVAAFHQGLANKQRGEIRKLRLIMDEFIFLAKKSNY